MSVPSLLSVHDTSHVTTSPIPYPSLLYGWVTCKVNGIGDTCEVEEGTGYTMGPSNGIEPTITICGYPVGSGYAIGN